MQSDVSSTLQPPEEPNVSSLEAAFDQPFPQPRDIDISFFSYKTRRSTLLVSNNSSENHVRARRNWLDFDFIDVIYVTEIRVYASGYEDFHGMELSYAPYLNDQEERKVTANFTGGHFHFAVGDFTKGFGLRPNDPMFKSAELKRVDVLGVERQNITGILKFVDRIDIEKASAKTELSKYFSEAQGAYDEIVEHEAKLVQIDTELEHKNEELKELVSQNQAAMLTYKKTQEDIEVAATVANEQASRADNLQQSIDKLMDERRGLTQEIVDSDRQLAEIKANINLFPTDLNGYVRQGTRNVRLYACLCIIPLGVIVAVTLRLFSNSERLLDTLVQLKGINIFEFLASRLPYVAVSLTVLGICYSIVRSMVAEIIAINRRRQELHKISIIAQDVSYASQDGLDLSTEEKYDLRTQTKMELLKEHLRQNVGDEFVYAPKRTFLEHLNRFPRKDPLSQPETTS